MVRRYRRRTFSRDKYSIEQTAVITPSVTQWPVVPAGERTQASFQYRASVVPPSDIEGMRKVKHLTLSFSSTADLRIFYALVYVPSGYEPNNLNVPDIGEALSLYEPNQYVMSSGVLDFTGGPLRIRTPLSRNLNSGDSIGLILGTPNSPDDTLAINVKYAITLQ